MVYMTTIRQLASKGANWWAYDVQFCQRRRTTLTPWHAKDYDLWVEVTMTMAPQHLPLPRHPKLAENGRASYLNGRGGFRIPRSFWFKYHSGKTCTAGGNCQYSHSCLTCGRAHSANGCSFRNSQHQQSSTRPVPSARGAQVPSSPAPTPP